MVFVSRERVLFYEQVVAAAVMGLLIGVMGLWITTLKRQIRARQETESALVESTRRLG